MKKTSNIKISIGIPTYEAGESLAVTLKSLYEQTAFASIREILVVVDGNTITKDIQKEIRNPKLIIKSYSSRKGQSHRINDIFRELNTPIIILTNDDVIFEKNAVKNIMKTYSTSQTDLISGNVKPINTDSLFEKSLKIGNDINNKVAKMWNKGSNYLSVNGRFVALSKPLYKKIKIPQRLWNNDAYLYLFAKTNIFSFLRCDNAIVYYKSPKNIKEHLRQSRKFQNSYMDNQRFFSQDISSFYAVGFYTRMVVSLAVFIANPLLFMNYILIYSYTRLYYIVNKKTFKQKPFWETDKSTKAFK